MFKLFKHQRVIPASNRSPTHPQISPLWLGSQPAASPSPPRLETVLLTGASAGLGLAVARLLLATDYRLILTARRSSLSRFVHEGITESARVFLRPLDVTQPQERALIIEEAEQRWGGVDILINNAAVAYRSVVEHAKPDEFERQMNVNFHGPMELIRLVLSRMRAQGAGRIINISSVGGMMAMPTMALYSASKFALEGATESLWYEMRPYGVHVTLVEPGFIHSASFRNTLYTAGARDAEQDVHAPYHTCYRAMADFIARRMDKARATPEQVARVILRTMRRRHPPLRVRATTDAQLFEFLRRYFPRQMYHRLLYRALPKIKSWGNSA